MKIPNAWWCRGVSYALLLLGACVPVEEASDEAREQVPSEAVAHTTAALAEGEAVAVPTFHSIGLRWKPTGASASNPAQVRFRPLGSSTWQTGLQPWFDDRACTTETSAWCREYRGSLVHLRPGTTYEVELKLPSTGVTKLLTAKTWAETVPVSSALTVQLPELSNETLSVTQGGTAQGYALYAPAPGKQAVIDARNSRAHNIVVSASYVVLRGLTLKGAQSHAIVLQGDVHDVFIEDLDISGWGRLDTTGFGRDYESAIYSNSTALRRVIIQRNLFHHPRGDANNWCEDNNGAHPRGAQAISLFNSAGNHVIRYNEVRSDDTHYFNDGFGGGSNFSYAGFPNRDTDIYGNHLERAWDNPIEAEGANLNVRIWGNFIDKSYSPLGIAATSVGPLYVWRNVTGTSRRCPSGTTDSDSRGRFIKGGSSTSNSTWYGGGRTYLFHNTLLQPTASGAQYPLGVSRAIDGTASGGDMVNVVTRNNLFQVHRSTGDSIYDTSSTTRGTNDFDYDLYNGDITSPRAQEAHGIRGTPRYASLDIPGGNYALASDSPGYDQGARLANFNDGFQGTAPDMGAHEAGAPPMRFGRAGGSGGGGGGSFPPSGPGYLTLSPTQDATVQGGQNASLNQGTALTLEAKDGDASADFDRRAFLQFSLAGLGLSTVERATLWVYVHELKHGAPVPLQARFSTSDDWTESTVTWLSQPAVDATVLGSAMVGDTGWVPLDVTSFVQSELAQGFTRLTLAVLAEPVARNVAVRSRENTTPDERGESAIPRLVLEP